MLSLAPSGETNGRQRKRSPGAGQLQNELVGAGFKAEVQPLLRVLPQTEERGSRETGLPPAVASLA